MPSSLAMDASAALDDSRIVTYEDKVAAVYT